MTLALRSRRLAQASLLAAAVSLCSTDLLQDAVANGDTRTLSFHHVHSGASATVTFKRNGRYDPAALRQLNVLLQDWRRKEPTNMDPQLFDIVWEVYRETGATAPVEVIGGYRSPATNAMLRSRSRGVAQTSLHMQGKAMDFFIPGVPLSKIREAGLRLQRGGVGFYPTSGSPFVHLDTGGVRHWPRMTRTELARVFPDGKTVHVPTDGKPMPRYELALAEVESKGKEPGGVGAAFAGLSGGNDPKRAGAAAGGSKNLFASLFGGGKEDDDEESAAPVARSAPVTAPATAPAPVQVAAAEPADIPRPQPSPMPRGATAVADAPAPAAVPFAVAAMVPRPLSRPADAPKLPAAAEPAALQVANAAVPRPQARPGALPELIVGSSVDGAPALAYASASTGIFPSERLQPGRAPAPAPSAAAAPSRSTGANGLRGTVAPYPPEMQAEIRRLFSSPTVATHVVMRTPELRRFAAFVAPPRQVVAGGFSKTAPASLNTSRFEGAAVVAVPVVAMMSGAAPLAKPL
ncbi:DUF882 domain-containing protein [Ancylobacter sp. A5.8]|uniref:DUF882 domain-containing protein n=1 Tax=Ancylobacter gelatini TaxID=2919920 RepID=UPI001F4DC5A6|nr:DUF882 domain-containing protein [Ancylobacter gelatini]MCJ8144685.1 DUF882 domain-containing protein [Ancylobacter gelatini]